MQKQRLNLGAITCEKFNFHYCIQLLGKNGGIQKRMLAFGYVITSLDMATCYTRTSIRQNMIRNVINTLLYLAIKVYVNPYELFFSFLFKGIRRKPLESTLAYIEQ